MYCGDFLLWPLIAQHELMAKQRCLNIQISYFSILNFLTHVFPYKIWTVVGTVRCTDCLDKIGSIGYYPESCFCAFLCLSFF